MVLIILSFNFSIKNIKIYLSLSSNAVDLLMTLRSLLEFVNHIEYLHYFAFSILFAYGLSMG